MEAHDLKVWKPYLDHIINGKKTFEYRKNDRGFHVGDYLILREQDPDIEEYTGYMQVMKVTYIIRDKEAPPKFGVPKGYCIIRIELLKPMLRQRSGVVK